MTRQQSSRSSAGALPSGPVGIISWGGYIPRLRLQRMAIYQSMGWFAPALLMVAQGERSFCNWDEDALTMAVEASRRCLAGMGSTAIDALYLASTTLPFADRLNAGIVKTALNLGDHVQAADFASSMRAGTTALTEALAVLQGGARKRVLLAASDMRQTRAAFFYEMWFGDGAASLLLGSEDLVAEFLGSYSVTHDFVDHYRGAGRSYDYTWEERWVRDQGYARIIPEAVNGLFQQLSISMDDVDKFVFPCFFKKQHAAVARSLGAPPEKVPDNLHEVCGETGAAHPLVMLVNTLEHARPGERILLAGFGQGCDALYFRVTDAIQRLPARHGIARSLEQGLSTGNYTRFLRFRGLLDTEMGIRAERPTKTAMTVLWRKRGMITGLVGGRCKTCGTRQFPGGQVCVNPECRARGPQEPVDFSDEPATIQSYTGDLLAVSVDPPATYGMIQFQGGGRMIADFTDCKVDDLHVGQQVRMSFRKRYADEQRGFTGYFWKAVPLHPQGAGKEDRPREQRKIRFDGKVAIVTGAGAGLGRVYALDLARRGAMVVVNDLGGAADGTGPGSAAAADEVVAQVVREGGQAVANYDSVATPEGGAAIVQAALDAFGRVDILVNNAGILRDRTLAKMTSQDWKAVMDVHLDGAFNVTRPAFQQMRDQGYGRIVVTTSAAGLYGNFGQTNYSAAKMGLLGLMNSLKLEGQGRGVTVNAVAPIAATRLTRGILPPAYAEKLAPEFVSPLVLYFCSEECQDSGLIVNAGMGWFSRAAFMAGSGLVLEKRQEPPTLKDIHRGFAAMGKLSSAREHADATAALGYMLQVLQGDADGGAQQPSGRSVASIMENLPAVFLPEKAVGLDLVFQFRITGDGGGEWYARIHDGRCSSAAGVHDSPTTTIIMSRQDFMALVQGRLDAMQAFTTGRLKVEGDLMKSQLIQEIFAF